jgi:hypothetical protein
MKDASIDGVFDRRTNLLRMGPVGQAMSPIGVQKKRLGVLNKFDDSRALAYPSFTGTNDALGAGRQDLSFLRKKFKLSS